MSSRRPQSGVALVAAALVAAGCGTTVSPSAVGTSEVGVAGTTATPGATSGDSSLSVPGQLAAGGGSTPNGVGGGTAGPGGAPSTSSTIGGTTASTNDQAAASQQGVGVTATAVYLGVPYTDNSDEANAALGAGGLNSGDSRADYKAVVDDINAHGGVAGRKLVPIFHRYDATSQEPSADQDQAACSDFTEDHHVAGVVSVGVSDNFTPCVTRAGAIEVDASVLVGPDKAEFSKYPYYFDAGLLSQDRLMAAYVPSLVRQHYFTGWNADAGRPGPGKAKIGVLGVDVPEWNRPTDHVFLPALRDAGYNVAAKDVIRIHNPNSAAEDSQTLAQIQNSVLRFRSDGVTHVIFLDTRGSFLTFFGKDAKAQRYFPRFGIDSGSAVQTIYDAGLADADQLNGAVGLGWNPATDLSPKAAAQYNTPAHTECLRVVRKRSGQALSGADEQAVAISACDEVRLFARAVELAGPVINHDTLRGAIESLHGGFVPAGLPAAYFGPGRHDAAELGFDLAWNASCTCAKYTNGPFRIP